MAVFKLAAFFFFSYSDWTAKNKQTWRWFEMWFQSDFHASQSGLLKL